MHVYLVLVRISVLLSIHSGAIFQALLHGSKNGVVERFEGHYGPITGESGFRCVFTCFCQISQTFGKLQFIA